MDLYSFLKYLRKIGISENVIKAFEVIKREWFVPEEYKDRAYYDEVTPLFDNEVTVSQPSLVAKMLDELELYKGLKVLEIGTGSGFSTALTSYLVGENGLVVSIDIDKRAYNYAKERLDKLIDEKVIPNNIKLILGNGYFGYKELSPYDRIIAHVGIMKVPEYWLDQIKNGIIIAPVGDIFFQKLMKYIIKDGKIVEEKYLDDVIFVMMK